LEARQIVAALRKGQSMRPVTERVIFGMSCRVMQVCVSKWKLLRSRQKSLRMKSGWSGGSSEDNAWNFHSGPVCSGLRWPV